MTYNSSATILQSTYNFQMYNDFSLKFLQTIMFGLFEILDFRSSDSRGSTVEAYWQCMLKKLWKSGNTEKLRMRLVLKQTKVIILGFELNFFNVLLVILVTKTIG